VPVPRPVIRALLVVGLLVGAVFAAVGGLALRAPGVIAVGVAGLLAGLTAAAIAHDAPRHTLRTTVESAVLAAAGTVGGLLVVSGTAAMLGGPVTVGLLAAVVLAVLLRSGRRADAASGTARRARRAEVVPLPVASVQGDSGPVSVLSTAALGREWLRTTAALAAGVDAAARRAIVERREATLDELERRDPVGFGRWLSDGPSPDSDPSEYVRGGPVPGTEAA
jgi:hypothetical protein